MIYMLISSIIYFFLSINNEESEFYPQNIIDDLLGPTSLTLARAQGNSDDALKQKVEQILPIIAVFGGMALGMVCVLSDIMEIIGGVPGMLISVGLMNRIHQIWKDEKRKIQWSIK